MLVTEFNFVVAGLATFAATVGYACTRRLSTSMCVKFILVQFSPLTTCYRPRPNADQIRENLLAESEKSSQTSSSDDSNMVVEQTPTVSPTRKETLKRKIPHDGFDEPEKPVSIIVPES